MNYRFLYLEFNPHLISNIEEPLWLCNLGFNNFNLKMRNYVHNTKTEFPTTTSQPQTRQTLNPNTYSSTTKEVAQRGDRTKKTTIRSRKSLI